jgi:putative SOS response-associated peptidase YedK
MVDGARRVTTRQRPLASPRIHRPRTGRIRPDPQEPQQPEPPQQIEAIAAARQRTHIAERQIPQIPNRGLDLAAISAKHDERRKLPLNGDYLTNPRQIDPTMQQLPPKLIQRTKTSTTPGADLPENRDLVQSTRIVNARAETVHEKPSFRTAFRSKRALIAVDAFYEWLETDQVSEKTGQPLKQPFALRPADGHTLALAGLYEVWTDKSKPEGDPDRLVPTYTIITTTATDSVGRIHDRMPMAITADNWDAWLDPRNTDVDHIRELMAPPLDDSLEIYAVSTAVNSVRNNGPHLLDPLPAS